MALATKTESHKIFEKLKTKAANKVRRCFADYICATPLTTCRYVLTVVQRTQHGRQCPLAYTSALTAQPTTVIWGCTFPLCAPPTWTVRDASTTTQTEKILILGYSMAVGPTTDHEGWRKRVGDQVLPVTWGLCCA
jgi:cytochrome bd-type quinol oxidase subunit 2